MAADAASLYDLLLRECCAHAIELARALPGADITALAEVLRRERPVSELVLRRRPELVQPGQHRENWAAAGHATVEPP